MPLYSTTKHGDDPTVQQMSGALHSPCTDSGRGGTEPCSPPRQLAGLQEVRYGGT